MQKIFIETKELVKKEKYYTYLILNNLKKIEIEKLYCDLGYSSLHAYLEKELNYSSSEAALRVANVKLMLKVPAIETPMAQGKINLTQGGNLFSAYSKSTEENKSEKIMNLVELVEGKSTRESEKLINESFDLKSNRDEKIIISNELKGKLERLKKIYGEKSYTELFEILVDEKLMDQKSETRDVIIKEKIKPTSRTIPKILKKAVIVRAQKCCEFTSADGLRCNERRRLEFEHVIPFSKGGGHTKNNLKLYCRNHNQRARIKVFGRMNQNQCWAGKVN